MLDFKVQPYLLVTEFTYDKANQLVSSICEGKRTEYHYDAAGRLVREGEKTYTYGYLDKVLGLRDGKSNTTYDYTIAGQLASLTTRNSELKTDSTESFLWDGLALIRRGGVNYLNEPHAGGGAALLAGGHQKSAKPKPVAWGDRDFEAVRGHGARIGIPRRSGSVMFNDVLGTTLGIEGEGGTFSTARGSAYGEADSTDHLFTGKPYVEGLGHAFLLRNYRADLGKWQTADPLGHPDGWNNFAYCNGQVTGAVDLYGAYQIKIHDMYGNISTDISNASQLHNPKLKTGDGSFTFDTPGVYTDDNNELIIAFVVGLNVDTSRYEENSKIGRGAEAGYLPHCDSEEDSESNRQFPVEAAIAHEMGHAAVFFGGFMSFFRNALNEAMQIAPITAATVSSCYSLAKTRNMAAFLDQANRATRDSFRAMNWRFDDYFNDGYEKWVKE